MGAAVAAAVTFVWLGTVLGISFLEAPLKFRAPGVTLPIGLGIGRLVFDSIQHSDLPMIQGTVLIGTFFIVMANLVVDIVYAFLDPRVRYA